MEIPFKILSINFLLILMFILVIELIFGSWLKDTKKSYIIASGTLIEKYQLNINNDQIKISFTIEEICTVLEAIMIQINQIKILTVGGSTTDQINVSEDETWSYIIQNNFLNAGKNIYVANAGVMGQTTFGHIENF